MFCGWKLELWSTSVPPNIEGPVPPVNTVAVAGKVEQKVPDADDRG